MNSTYTQNVHDTQAERRLIEIKTKTLTQKFVKLVGTEKAREIALELLKDPITDKNSQYSPSKFYDLYLEKFHETKAALNNCACGSCKDQRKFQTWINASKITGNYSPDEIKQYKRIRNRLACKIQGF